jgi:hypothetical protein
MQYFPQHRKGLFVMKMSIAMLLLALPLLSHCSLVPSVAREASLATPPQYLSPSGAVQIPGLQEEQQMQVVETFKGCRLREEELRKSAEGGALWQSFWTVFGSVMGPLSTAGGAYATTRLSGMNEQLVGTLVSAGVGAIFVSIPAILASAQSNRKTRAADILQRISAARAAVFNAVESEQSAKVEELRRSCMEAQ